VVRSGTPDGADNQQSLGDLVALAAKDVSQLIRYEISLAKSELRMDARRAGIIGALSGFSAVALSLMLVMLCFAYAYGLDAAGAPGGLWGAFLWVFLTLVVLFLIACGIAYLVMRRVSGMRLTRKTVTEDLGMLRREAGLDGSGTAVAVPPRAGGPAELPARQ
jgi:membrane protein implicated in regulation of membrane protease activity